MEKTQVKVNSSFKVCNDFLPASDFSLVQQTFASDSFPWYWGQNVLSEDYTTSDSYRCSEEDNFQFVHWIYTDARPINEYFDTVVPIINKLRVGAICKIKANLNPRTEETVEHGFHCDQDWIGTKTAVYYVNTCNGYTLFEESGEKVYSKANRLVVFDGPTSHTGSTCTDEKRRIVINFNYYEVDK